jgi:type IV pilus assembly protein PilF
MSLRNCAALASLALLLAGCDSMPRKDGGGPTSESVSMTGNPSDARNRAKVHAELAALYFSRGNMAIALEELRIAAAADADYPLTYSLFGLVYMQLREPKLAQENFERGLRLSPNDPDINHNYGWFLCQSGREDESIKYFTRAVSNPLYPNSWRSYSAAGLCSMRKNRLKEAEDFFQRALRQEPDEPGSLLQLGHIRYRQGNMEDARKLVSRHNRIVEPTAESLWLALRVERKLGERVAESNFANQLRRRFAASREYQQLQRGEYD